MMACAGLGVNSVVFVGLVAGFLALPVGLAVQDSLLVSAGIPVHVVAAIHGHDPVITQRIYAHTQHAEAVAAMDMLDRLLNPDV